MKTDVYHAKFVETVPEQLKPGILYISERFRTASHLCACGCGTKVVTPLKPAKWQLIKTDRGVSLCPSIGRWQLPCKSHYWIRNNGVVWSRQISDEEMQEVLRRDQQALRDYYDTRKRQKGIVARIRRVIAWLQKWIVR